MMTETEVQWHTEDKFENNGATFHMVDWLETLNPKKINVYPKSVQLVFDGDTNFTLDSNDLGGYANVDSVRALDNITVVWLER